MIHSTSHLIEMSFVLPPPFSNKDTSRSLRGLPSQADIVLSVIKKPDTRETSTETQKREVDLVGGMI